MYLLERYIYIRREKQVWLSINPSASDPRWQFHRHARPLRREQHQVHYTYYVNYLDDINAYAANSRCVEALTLPLQTHVDNSIDTPVPFVENNIRSTIHIVYLLETKHLLCMSVCALMILALAPDPREQLHRQARTSWTVFQKQFETETVAGCQPQTDSQENTVGERGTLGQPLNWPALRFRPTLTIRSTRPSPSSRTTSRARWPCSSTRARCRIWPTSSTFLRTKFTARPRMDRYSSIHKWMYVCMQQSELGLSLTNRVPANTALHLLYGLGLQLGRGWTKGNAYVNIYIYIYI